MKTVGNARLFRFERHHPCKKPFAGFCAENVVIRFPTGCRARLPFKKIDKKISFDQDAVIHAIDIAIGMMMSHQKSYALCHLQRPSKTCQQLPCCVRPDDLLILTSAAAKFLHCFVDTDVMHQGSAFQSELLVLAEVFSVPYRSSQFVDLEKMMNQLRIPLVEFDHCLHQTHHILHPIPSYVFFYCMNKSCSLIFS